MSYAKPTSGTDNVLKDAAGNEVADFTDREVTNATPDAAAPRVVSVVRQDPATSPTRSNTLKWRVTFSEDVDNVDAADFALSGTTATLTVTEVTASTVYDVTAAGGNLAALNGTVTLAFAAGHNIQDQAATPNALANTTPTGTNDHTYLVDNAAPTFSSAALDGTALALTFSETLATAAPANEAFTVKKGADTLALTGTPSISGAVVTLTLASAAQHGETGFSVAYTKPGAGNKLADPAGNETGTFTDQTVTNATPDAAAPRVVSVVRQDPATSPTRSNTLKWRVTFSEDVDNVDAADFALSGTTATLTVTEVTASTVYDVTAAGGNLAALNGTVTLAFAAGHNIQDKAATPNALANTTPTGTDEPSYVLDNAAPTVSSASLDGTALELTFGEDLAAAANLTNGAFTVKRDTDVLALSSSTPPALAGATVTLTLETAAVHGASGFTVSYAKPTSGTDNVLKDAAGNEVADFTDREVTNATPDAAAPRVVSVVRQDPATSPTRSNTLKWRVTFSEDVDNVDAADFALSGTTATLTVTEVTASTVYDVTASGGNLAALNGTVTLAFAAGHNIQDKAATPNALANTTPTGTNDHTYLVDNAAPTFSSAALDGTALALTFSETLATAAPANEAFTVKKGADTLALTGTPSISGAVVTLTLASAAQHGETGFSVAYTKPGAGNKLADPAGNETGTFTDQTVTNATPDAAAPRVVSVVRQDPATSPTRSNTLKWRVTFSEDVDNVDAADFALNGTTATLAVATVTASTVYDVTASGGNLAELNGTVTLSFDSGQDIQDKAATPNALANTTPTGTNDHTYLVDNAAPTFTSASLDGTALALTFSETLATAAPANEAFTVKKGADTLALTGTPSISGAVVTLTLASAAQHGETGFSVAYTKPGAGNKLADPAGNETGTFTDQTVTNATPDAAAPRVVSVVRQDPATSPTRSNTLKWRVTFSEDVDNVDAADFALSGTTATLTVTEVTASTVYDVTAAGGNLAALNGTVTLAFAAGQDIQDQAATPNALANTTPTGTDEPSYLVDNAAPTFSSAALDGTALALTFSETLATAAPANEAFTVKKGADTLALTGTPSISGAVVTLTLASAAQHGETGFSVAYTKPGAGNKLADPAGNETGTFTDQTVTNATPDAAAPRVVSVVRQDPATSPTRSNTLKWRVTFSEDVDNVDPADFALNGTTATLAVATVTASTVYDVTASGATWRR